MDHRLNRAMATFWKCAKALRCKAAPLQERFKIFRERVLSVATYACASWVLTKQSLQRLITWENVLLRRIMHIGRGADEPWPDYVRRHTRAVRTAYHQSGVQSLVVTALENVD